MSKINPITFRVNVPNATLAGTPVTVELQPMSSHLQRVTIFTMSAVDITKFGFRLRNTSVILIPESGSNDNITLLAGEAGWSPILNNPLEFHFGGRPLSGPPFTLTLEFYNTTGAAVVVGGVVHTCMPEYTMHDLVNELRSARDRIIPVHYDKQIDVTEISDNPAYPVMRQGKK